MSDPQAEHEKLLHGICLTVASTIVIFAIVVAVIRLFVDWGAK